MHPGLEKILSETVVQTLEKLAFIFASSEDDFEALNLEEADIAKVSFKGPFSGTLVMAIAKEALPELAANMLGEDNYDAVTIEQKQDTLKETLNIICGNLLPDIDKTAVFDIDAPETTDHSFFDEAKRFPHKITANLSLDEGSCVVWLFIEDEVLPDFCLEE